MLSNYLLQFGAAVTPADKLKYQEVSNWNGKTFDNLSKTTIDVNIRTLPKLLYKSLTNRQDRQPVDPIPYHPSYKTKKATKATADDPYFIWFGHSVSVISIGGVNLLIDPMFGPDAAPIAPIRSPRFSSDSLDLIDELPHIDAVLLTHDHYDHLDLQSIQKLMPKVSQYYVSMGVGRHLRKWGVPSDQIQELAWWDSVSHGDVQLTFTPSRHFSGRGLGDRTQCLWGGWVIQSKDSKIYWSGDGGYDYHFKEIGAKFGPFDYTFIECGQYNKLWKQIHLHPEEAVQAAIDAGSDHVIPVHWAGFSLATHTWKEPVDRFWAEATKKKLNVCVPQIGEVVSMNQKYTTEKWWESIA